MPTQCIQASRAEGHPARQRVRLRGRLGGLPLALEQAAAYVDANRWNFVEYPQAFTGVSMLERQAAERARVAEARSGH